MCHTLTASFWAHTSCPVAWPKPRLQTSHSLAPLLGYGLTGRFLHANSGCSVALYLASRLHSRSWSLLVQSSSSFWRCESAVPCISTDMRAWWQVCLASVEQYTNVCRLALSCLWRGKGQGIFHRPLRPLKATPLSSSMKDVKIPGIAAHIPSCQAYT